MKTLPARSALHEWRQQHYTRKRGYITGQTSSIVGLPPNIATRFKVLQTLEILREKLGDELLARALDPSQTIESPIQTHTSPDWMKHTNMVGVNVRTIGSFLNVINYAFTLPHFHDAIHLLPIWEPGVVGSLYGKVSFYTNPEFFDHRWAEQFPQLNTPAKQLKVAVNLLHALGKKVGMDVIPHTDRFSEMVLTNPRHFEWVQQRDGQLLQHGDHLSEQVEALIWNFLQEKGTANGSYLNFGKEVFFDASVPLLTADQRRELLFGSEHAYQLRLERRVELLYRLVAEGYETLPMTMAPPYRGLHINADSFITDGRGHRWYEYAFDKPEGMSRVFGPLTRYRFYESGNNWELDFERPVKAAWDTLANAYVATQQAFNFDFMRGDMAHVQPRPQGVPAQIDEYYDPLRYIKRAIQKNSPGFAFFAETFIVEPDTMGYGNEYEHLEKIEAEATLGDLQASAVHTTDFIDKFTTYKQLGETYAWRACFTIITADKDDPRFDEFYREANHVRYFMGLFLTDWPSYYSLGFELRNPNLTRGQNEEYSKLFVFQIKEPSEPDKFTTGPYRWGGNYEQFQQLEAIREIATALLGKRGKNGTHWLHQPTENEPFAVWTSESIPNHIIACELHPEHQFSEEWVSTFQNAAEVFSCYAANGSYRCVIVNLGE